MIKNYDISTEVLNALKKSLFRSKIKKASQIVSHVLIRKNQNLFL